MVICVTRKIYTSRTCLQDINCNNECKRGECRFNPLPAYHRLAWSNSLVLRLAVVDMVQKTHRQRNEQKIVRRFDRCNLRQVTDAFAACQPLLVQSVVNIVPSVALWGNGFRKGCRHFGVKNRTAYLAPVLRYQEKKRLLIY